MKYLKSILIILSLFITFEEFYAQQGSFGMGLIIGEPTGVSAKLWISKTSAIDFGIGWSLNLFKSDISENADHRIHIHFDYLVHSISLIGNNGEYPLYCGVGGGANFSGSNDILFVIRIVAGLAWMPHETPFEFFTEIAFVPTFEFSEKAEFTFDFGLGVRYYFN